MLLCFVRHGQADRHLTGVDNRDAPLTAQGREQALAAGKFLADLGITPDLVISTDTRRTRKTAHIVLQGLEIQRPVNIVRHGWRAGASRAQIEARVREWIRFAPTTPEVVLLVAHGVQLRSILRAFCVEPAFGVKHGAVVIVETSDAALMADEGS